MVQAGDRVRLQGREVKVTSVWGQGKHTAFALEDGRTVLDLHLMIERGDAEVLAGRAPEPVEEPKLTRRQRREIERSGDSTPMFGEDHED